MRSLYLQGRCGESTLQLKPPARLIDKKRLSKKGGSRGVARERWLERGGYRGVAREGWLEKAGCCPHYVKSMEDYRLQPIRQNYHGWAGARGSSLMLAVPLAGKRV